MNYPCSCVIIIFCIKLTSILNYRNAKLCLLNDNTEIILSNNTNL